MRNRLLVIVLGALFIAGLAAATYPVARTRAQCGPNLDQPCGPGEKEKKPTPTPATAPATPTPSAAGEINTQLPPPTTTGANQVPWWLPAAGALLLGIGIGYVVEKLPAGRPGSVTGPDFAADGPCADVVEMYDAAIVKIKDEYTKLITEISNELAKPRGKMPLGPEARADLEAEIAGLEKALDDALRQLKALKKAAVEHCRQASSPTA